MTNTLDGKNIVITGANSGIGKAAAIQLAQLGASVILACRSVERGGIALSDVRSASQSQKVELMQVDMALQDSIRAFVQAHQSRYNRLDVLIHNAANFDHRLTRPQLTEDGIETVFATNHIGVVLMTHLFLDLLKASAPSRIITVASKGLIAYPLLNIEFENLNGERKYSLQRAYYHAKLAQIMYTLAMANRLRGTGVTINCVRVTNVAIPDERLSHLPAWLRKIYSIKRNMSITPEQMAQTYTFLAADPSVETISGGYWDEHCRQVKANRNAYNKQTQDRLLKVSMDLAGIA